jgi:transposase
MKFDLLRRQQLARAKAAADAALRAKVAAMSDEEIAAALDNPVGRRLQLMSDEELEKLAGY